MSSPRTTEEDLRPGEGKRLLKLLVVPVAGALYALAEGLPLNGSSPVYIDNDLFTLGAMLFVAFIAYYTGKTRARTEARVEAATKS